MNFASSVPVPRYPLNTNDTHSDITLDGRNGYPGIKLNDARIVLRLSGEVTDERLKESLENAVQSIQTELLDWKNNKSDQLSDDENRLYTRAVYFYAKAELIERYKDFDLTGKGERRSENYSDAVDEARRNVRWAISDLLGKPRMTIEVL